MIKVTNYWNIFWQKVYLWAKGNLAFRLGHNINKANWCLKHSPETSTAHQDWVARLELSSHLKQPPKMDNYVK